MSNPFQVTDAQLDALPSMIDKMTSGGMSKFFVDSVEHIAEEDSFVYSLVKDWVTASEEDRFQITLHLYEIIERKHMFKPTYGFFPVLLRILGLGAVIGYIFWDLGRL